MRTWNGSRAAMHEHLVALAKNPPKYKTRKQKRKKQKSVQPQPWVGDYKQYLLGKWWRHKRHQKLQSTRWKCERCGQRANQVHHLHYKTLGREKNTDLQSICRGCHMREHEGLIAANSHLAAITS